MTTIHIDRDRLYDDLVYRVDYISAFIGFSEKDKQLIRDSAPVVEPLIPEIVDHFYEKIFSYDIVKVKLLSSTDYDGEIPDSIEDLDLSGPLMEFRRFMLTKYFNRLLNSQWDTAYLKYLDWVARSHSKTPDEGVNKIDIEFVFLNGMMGYLDGIITDALSKIKEWDDDTRTNTILAYNKFFYIQSDLFSKYQILDDQRGVTDSIISAKKSKVRSLSLESASSSKPTLLAVIASSFILGSALAFALKK
ncbi:hypothetical protein BB560_000237 [Smittium megazygosporum]|uniref:Globin-sensor domain-containing protein n=1 Tax=Smittium megazygosporum TaxID=133381 RepID=A0A2T9ZKV5_9FUNG|nr:hypothetical protein BB560_000237 [Smittium megazygosporum]